MKRLITLFAIYLIALSAFSASDHIILRDGQEYDVKLRMLDDELVVFNYGKNGKGERVELPTRQLYMVYVNGQGNLYIDPNGNRVTGEAKRANPSKTDVIYLLKGKEIAAEDITITPTEVIYKVKVTAPSALGLVLPPIITEYNVDKSQVFMIRYRNGERVIITPFDTCEEIPVKG